MARYRYELRGAYGESNKALSSHRTLRGAGRAHWHLSWHETGGASLEHRAYVLDTKTGDRVTDEAVAEYRDQAG